MAKPIMDSLPSEQRSLTTKQQVFIDHYVSYLRPIYAAKMAGYKADAKSLSAIASRNLYKANIATAMREKGTAYRYGIICLVAKT